MGWGGVTAWKHMPKLWKEIKKAKREEGLWFVLQQEWDKCKSKLDIQFYNIYLSEEILMTLWKVIFTKSDRTAFTTSKSCLSPLVLMPRP